MNKLGLYLRLAARNLFKNRQYYGPFFLTAAGCAAMCYIMRFLGYNDLVSTMRGSAYVQLMLGLGSFIMVFLVVWIMSYANGFVIRRRTKELALYGILGMEKRNVGAVLGLETLFLYLAGTALGVFGGALLSKLVLLLLLRLVRFEVTMGFSFSTAGAAETFAAFALLFLFLYLRNLRVVRKTSPIELLHTGSMGEREPKSRILLALFGLLTLAGGYAISFFTTNFLFVILLFFAAVALVIVGTHCLFGAGSVVVLKALRKNKALYYRPRNFTAISGLIYRMNQNARGLANICILATTVLVSVATTVCLYAGTGETIEKMYPNDLTLSVNFADDGLAQENADAWEAPIRQAAAEYGVSDGEMESFYLFAFGAQAAAGNVYTPALSAESQTADTPNLLFMTADDYSRLTGQTVTLAEGEILARGLYDSTDSLTIGDTTYHVVGEAEEFPAVNGGYSPCTVCIVVPGTNTLVNLREMLVQDSEYAPTVRRYLNLNTDKLDAAAIDECANALEAAANPAPSPDWLTSRSYVYSREGMRAELYNMNGSFVFLGIFLAIMFTMATVLIIYYKQLSEGYEDRARFVILQQVGMSADEVRSTIRVQVLMVFFLPLVMAAVHLAAAFPILMRMVSAFGVTNTRLFLLCCLITLAGFALCYVAVYAMTSRKYYSIVKR